MRWQRQWIPVAVAGYPTRAGHATEVEMRHSSRAVPGGAYQYFLWFPLSSAPLLRFRVLYWSPSAWFEARTDSTMSAQHTKNLVPPSDFSSCPPSSAAPAVRRNRQRVYTQCSIATSKDGPVSPPHTWNRSFQGPSSTKQYECPSRISTCNARGWRLVVLSLGPSTAPPEPLCDHTIPDALVTIEKFLEVTDCNHRCAFFARKSCSEVCRIE